MKNNRFIPFLIRFYSTILSPILKDNSTKNFLIPKKIPFENLRNGAWLIHLYQFPYRIGTVLRTYDDKHFLLLS